MLNEFSLIFTKKSFTVKKVTSAKTVEPKNPTFLRPKPKNPTFLRPKPKNPKYFGFRGSLN